MTYSGFSLMLNGLIHVSLIGIATHVRAEENRSQRTLWLILFANGIFLGSHLPLSSVTLFTCVHPQLYFLAHSHDSQRQK